MTIINVVIMTIYALLMYIAYRFDELNEAGKSFFRFIFAVAAFGPWFILGVINLICS